MKAIVKVGDTRAHWWKEQMSSLLPEMEIFLADEIVDKTRIDFAIVWNRHPVG